MCSPDLLNSNFLGSSYACVGLVDHMRQVGDLGSFPSLSPEEKKNEALAKLQKEVIFATEAI